MTLLQLQYVMAVAKYANFTLAAEKCFVTQPTLSMQVQKLEEELEVLIFNRHKKPLELTDVGREIVEQAKRIDFEVSRIEDIVADSKKYIGGVFRLGIIPTVSSSLLPLFIRDFSTQYPKVNLIVEEVQTEYMIERVKDGSLDAGIAATPLHNKYLVEHKLYNEPFVAFIPKSHPLIHQKSIKPEDLTPSEILLLDKGHCFRHQAIEICSKADTYHQALHLNIKSGSFETLVNLVNQGVGVTLLPLLNTLNFEQKKSSMIRPFCSPIPVREISIITHNSQLKMHIIDAIREVILDKISQLPMSLDMDHDVLEVLKQ